MLAKKLEITLSYQVYKNKPFLGIIKRLIIRPVYLLLLAVTKSWRFVMELLSMLVSSGLIALTIVYFEGSD